MPNQPALTNPALPSSPVRGSLPASLLNILVVPGDVFDQVLAAPPRWLTWLVPMFLVCLASLILLSITATTEHAVTVAGQLQDAHALSAPQVERVTRHFQQTEAVAVCFGAVGGTCWLALVLWFVGRVFLKSAFAFSRALEVAGLTSMVLLLGTTVTALLVAASGNPAARPALSLLCSRLAADNPVRAVAEMLNLFHLWSTCVLAIGLSKLARVSVKEAAFWVLGFWFVTRLALTLLA